MHLAALVLLATLGAEASEPPRVAAARARVGTSMQRALSGSGVDRPRAMLLRVFKADGTLEVWVGDRDGGPFVHFSDNSVCASSGGPGPKARQGDGQVPEGLYTVEELNPWSQFHLSLRLDYPNAADRARNPRVPPGALGGDIYVHGGCATIGCIPIGDAAIEEVYLLAQDVRARGGSVKVLILPARPGTPRWLWLMAGAEAGRRSLWESLAAISGQVDARGLLPRVRATSDGAYAAE